MSELKKLIIEELKDEDFKKQWDNTELRYKVIEQLIGIRNKYNLSQTQLAKRLDTTQAVISRIENGSVNIGIDFLSKLAHCFNQKIEIKFS